MAKNRTHGKTLLEPEVAVKKLHAILYKLNLDIRGAIEAEAVLESANSFISGRTISSENSNAYIAVHTAMVVHLALMLSRIFDVGSRSRFPVAHQDKASIPVLLHILRQQPCRVALAQQARKWTGVCEEGQRCAALRALDEAIATYVAFLKKSRRSSSFRDFEGPPKH